MESRWKKFYYPGQHLTIDEGIIPFQGRSKYKQYNPMKPQKWGIKIFMLTDSITKYTYSAKIYAGKQEKEKNYTTKLVLELCKANFNKNHKLFIDNFYCSPLLARELEKVNIFTTGTVNRKRKSVPNFDFSNKDTEIFTSNNINICKFTDKKKTLLILSNCYHPQIDAVNNKPFTLNKYNEYMHAVDLVNQAASFYRYRQRTLKWWKSVFVEILEITINNAYILYRKFGGEF